MRTGNVKAFLMGCPPNVSGEHSPFYFCRYFGEPLFSDSLSTLLIPTRYNEEFLSTNKIAFWGDYYANIVVYNFQTDTYKKLFENDTFIEALRSNNAYTGPYAPRTTVKIKSITSKWIFLFVKPVDSNKSGRIDEKDPSVLFAMSLDGKTLKQLTDESENVVSLDNFDKQGFVLIKIQRDSDNDKSFKNEDRDFYFEKIGVADLTVGKGIEVK